MAGKLVAHSVLHEGPGLVGLSPAVIHYIITGSVEGAKDLVSTKDLYGTDLREILETQVINLLILGILRVSIILEHHSLSFYSICTQVHESCPKIISLTLSLLSSKSTFS